MSPRCIVVPLCLISSLAVAAEAPITIRVLTSDTEIAINATTVQTIHYEFKASNAAAARNMAQQTIPFSEQLERSRSSRRRR